MSKGKFGEPWPERPIWINENGGGGVMTEEKCTKEFYSGRYLIDKNRCPNRALAGSLFCGTHDPARIAARAAKRGPTQFERDTAAIRARGEERSNFIAEINGLRSDLDRAEAALEAADRVAETYFGVHPHHQAAIKVYRALRPKPSAGEGE